MKNNFNSLVRQIGRRQFNIRIFAERLFVLTLVLACFPFNSPGIFIDGLRSDIQPWASAAAQKKPELSP